MVLRRFDMNILLPRAGMEEFRRAVWSSGGIDRKVSLEEMAPTGLHFCGD